MDIELDATYTRYGLPRDLSARRDQLGLELTAGGVDQVMIVIDALGGNLTIRGSVFANGTEHARVFVKERLMAASLDLTVLQPGVSVDQCATGHTPDAAIRI